MTTSQPHRVLIIAAGMGSRLEHYTDECPKCMVEVGGQSILRYQLDAYAANNIRDIHIVRGYLADRLIVDGATYYLNENFKENNILHSAMCGLEAFDQPLLTSYSDIVFSSDVVKTLLETPGDIVLTVDRDWATTYKGRDKHPVEQAELTEVATDGAVTRVGKWVGPENTVGEFIGLAKFSEDGARIVRETWTDLKKSIGNNDAFRHAELFRKSYLTDLIEEIIARGHTVRPAYIEGGWREIDTVQDLDRAAKLFTI